MVLHFLNIFLNSFSVFSLFSGRITISSTYLNYQQAQVLVSQFYQRFCFLRFTFSTITGSVISSSNLNKDLLKITQLTYQWKMLFNRDITKKKHKKLLQFIQVYTFIMHEYNVNLFKSILVFFQVKSSRFLNILTQK